MGRKESSYSGSAYTEYTTTSEQQNTFNNPQNPTYRLPQISYDQRPANQPQTIPNRPYYQQTHQTNLDRADRVPKYHMKESHNQLYQAIYSNRSQDTTTSEQQNTFNNPQNPTYRLPQNQHQISYDQRPANQPQTIPNRPYYQQTHQTNLDRADRVPKYHMKESHNQLYQAIYSNISQDTTTSEQQNTFNNPQNPTYRLPQISYDQRPANQPQTITNIPYYLPQN
eukprot:887679_1